MSNTDTANQHLMVNTVFFDMFGSSEREKRLILDTIAPLQAPLC